ncbi:MAG: hypothetical protein HC884_02630 [Chloroflexaceae bacterium]|nr:hypothetical protein [Chloroflexaceae bacterium]
MEKSALSPVPDVVYVTRSVVQTIQQATRHRAGPGRTGGMLIGRRLEREGRVEVLIVGATVHHEPESVDVAYVTQQLPIYQDTYPNVGFLGTWHGQQVGEPVFRPEDVYRAHEMFADPAYKVKEMVHPVALAHPGGDGGDGNIVIRYSYLNRSMANQRLPFTDIPESQVQEIPDDDERVASERAAVAAEPAGTATTPSRAAGTTGPEARSVPSAPVSPPTVSSPPSSRVEAVDTKPEKGSNMKSFFGKDNMNMPVIAGAGLGILILLIALVVILNRSGGSTAALEEVDARLQEPSPANLQVVEYRLSEVLHENTGARISQEVAERYVQLGDAYLEQDPPDANRAIVSYENASNLAPEHEAAQEGKKHALAVQRCGEVEAAGDDPGQQMSMLESLKAIGIDTCPQGPVDQQLYQTRLQYLQELTEDGEYARARSVAESMRVSAEEGETATSGPLGVVQNWVRYDTALLEDDWAMATDALTKILATVGVSPSLETYPPKDYGERIGEVSELLAEANIAYAQDLQHQGNIDEAMTHYEAAQEAEGVAEETKQTATRLGNIAQQGKQLWNLANEAIEREDWGGMRLILGQLEVLPGFGSESRNPLTGQSVAELARVGDTVMSQQTAVAVIELEKTVQSLLGQTPEPVAPVATPPMVLTPTPLPVVPTAPPVLEESVVVPPEAEEEEAPLPPTPMTTTEEETEVEGEGEEEGEEEAPLPTPMTEGETEETEGETEETEGETEETEGEQSPESETDEEALPDWMIPD